MTLRTLALCAGAFGAGFALLLLPPAPADAGAEGSASSDAAAGVSALSDTPWLAEVPLFAGAGDAPVCRVDDAAGRSTAIDTGAKLARVRELLAAEAAAAGAEDVVVLSNRGYNYGADALVDPALIEFEARRQGR
ncbi:hypothetical protein KJ059_13460 [Myxococcota bacterium]|nr:hypothetical protein [Myxococcota bacterium]MCZ7617773.1 hypothetical protein [Myxococcota bacterium]